MKRSILTSALITCAMIAVPAQAGTATGTMPVSALVLETCAVIATPMVFAALTDVGDSAFDTTASVALTCTLGADYTVSLDNGTHASGGVRRMKQLLGNEFIPYQIYKDSNRTQPWGSNAGVNTLAGSAPLGIATYTAYGRIPTGVADVSAGEYNDLVTVTVDF